MTPETSDLKDVLARLGRLERQNRWCKRGSVLALLLAGVFLLAGAAQRKEKIVEAEKFLLRDASGKERASLAMTAEGPALLLLDEANRPRAQLSVSKNVPFLKLLDETGKARTQATLAAEGPEIRLVDQNGKLRVFVGLLNIGPRVRVLDQNEKIRAYLSHFTNDQSGNVGVSRGDGLDAAVLRCAGPSASLNLVEANRLRGQFTLTNEGPLLGLSDANGKQRAALSITKEGPRLKLLDAGEQVLFSRP